MTAVQLALEFTPIHTEFPLSEHEIDPDYSEQIRKLALKTLWIAFRDAAKDYRAAEWLKTTGVSWLQLMGYSLGVEDMERALARVVEVETELSDNAFDNGNYSEQEDKER